MEKYLCVCGYEYDPAVGDPDGGIAPGTPFESIPEEEEEEEPEEEKPEDTEQEDDSGASGGTQVPDWEEISGIRP